MTWSSRPPREIVARWAELPVVHVEPEPGTPEREAAVARMALGISKASAARRGARKRLLWGAGAIAAAAAVAVGIGALRHGWSQETAAFGHVRAVDGTVRVKRAGEINATQLSALSADLARGDEVVTSIGAHTQLDLSSGVRLSLGEASRLQLSDGAAPAASASQEREQVRLDAGKVRVEVPHLKSGRVFAVQTPDTEVTVHGTAFSVEVAPARRGAAGQEPGITHVAVSEGVVSVRSYGREVFLRAGSEWTSGQGTPAPLPLPITTVSPEPGVASAPAPSNSGAAAVSLAPTSTLAEQNQLMERALSASRKGQDAAAVVALRELLRRYPSTRLAHEARVELFRALARSGDRAGAGREARRYLQSYPDGFAREEARKLALDEH
jgi:hypothetical protein